MAKIEKKPAFEIEKDLKHIQHMLFESDGEITPSIEFAMSAYNDDVEDLKDRMAFWVLVAKVFLQKEIDRHKGWAKDQTAFAKKVEGNQASMYRVTCQAMLNHGIEDIKNATEYSSAKPVVKMHFEIDKKDVKDFLDEYPQYSVPVITMEGDNALMFARLINLEMAAETPVYKTTYELNKVLFDKEMHQQYSMFSDAYRMANGENHLKMNTVEVMNDVCSAFNSDKDKPKFVTARIEYTMLVRANNKAKEDE